MFILFTEFGRIVIGGIEENLLGFIQYALQRNMTVAGYLYVNTGGLYLLSPSIPEDGNIIEIQVYGYVKDDILGVIFQGRSLEELVELNNVTFPNDIATYLFVSVYRPDTKRGTYDMIHGPTRVIHGFAPGMLPKSGDILEWPVKEGDKIGVFIPDDCFVESTGESTSIKLCPSQVNFQTLECQTALFVESENEDEESIGIEEFQEVVVKLNVEVTLAPNDGKLSAILFSMVRPQNLICCRLRPLG